MPCARSFPKKTCVGEVVIANVVLARREVDQAEYVHNFPKRQDGRFPACVKEAHRDEVCARLRGLHSLCAA